MRSSLYEEANDTLISIENIRYEGTAVITPRSSVLNRRSCRAHVDARMDFLLRGTDQDGDLVTRYEIRDTTAGGGFFKLNGVVQAANETIL